MGSSVLEIVTNMRPKPQLMATLKMMGIIEIPDFDIYKAAKKHDAHPGERENKKAENLRLAARRLEMCANGCKDPFAKNGMKKSSAKQKTR